MANRISGNVIIVDSAMGNSFVLTSAGRTIHLDEFKIQTIAFFMLDTSASIIITQANTSLDVVYNSNMVTVGILSNNGAVVNNPHQMIFPLGFKTSELKVPTLTAGTGYIYLA